MKKLYLIFFSSKSYDSKVSSEILKIIPNNSLSSINQSHQCLWLWGKEGTQHSEQ